VTRSHARPDNIHLYLESTMTAALREHAALLDLSVSSYIHAVLDGAFRSGAADRLVMLSLEHGSIYVRRNVQPRDWTAGRGEAAFKDWRLRRRGHGGVKKVDGEGWFLEGPGVPQPMFMGHVRRDAERQASVHVRQLMEREAHGE
jgi:hypothetical protein